MVFQNLKKNPNFCFNKREMEVHVLYKPGFYYSSFLHLQYFFCNKPNSQILIVSESMTSGLRLMEKVISDVGNIHLIIYVYKLIYTLSKYFKSQHSF